MCPITGRSVLKFGPFVVDLHSGELRRNGIRIRLQEKSVRVLAVLAERHGQLVSRGELKKHLWPEDTFVDFEAGLNAAVAKLRGALADDAAKPRYIETVPRRGYRFLVSAGFENTAANGVNLVVATEVQPNGAAAVAPTREGKLELAPAAQRSGSSRYPVWSLAAGMTVVIAALAIAGIWWFSGRPAFSFNQRDSVLVTDFENQTGDPRFDHALRTAFIVSLEQSRQANVFPQVRVGPVLRLMGRAETDRITPEVGREICQRENIRGLIAGSITRTGREYALSAELIDPTTGATVRSYAHRSNGEEHILDALDAIAADVRRDLGEPRYQIHSAGRPLPEVTTSSLTALNQYAEGTELWHQGHYGESLTLLRTAAQSDPDFAMAHAALGRAYFSYINNSQTEGKQEYDKALALSSRVTDRERMIIQAHYADDLGHVSEADTLYLSYLSRHPDDWAMLSDYAYLLRTHGRAAEAVAKFKQLLKVAPDDANTYLQMGIAYKSLNDVPQALASFDEAFRLDPHWLVAGIASMQYASLLIERGDEQKAVQILTAVLQSKERAETGLRSLAELDLYHGRAASAKKRFEQCLRILQDQEAPLGRARVHLWLAMLAEEQGDIRGERQELDAANQFKGIGPVVVFGSWLGRQYERAHMSQNAQILEQFIALRADPKNSDQMGYLHLLQGEIAGGQGEADKSIELLTLANRENSNPFTIEALAHAYQQAGRIDQAIVWYEKLLAIPLQRAIFWEAQQSLLPARYTLASDYLARGDREKARQTIDALLILLKDADRNLPLRSKAILLRNQIH